MRRQLFGALSGAAWLLAMTGIPVGLFAVDSRLAPDVDWAALAAQPLTPTSIVLAGTVAGWGLWSWLLYVTAVTVLDHLRDHAPTPPRLPVPLHTAVTAVTGALMLLIDAVTGRAAPPPQPPAAPPPATAPSQPPSHPSGQASDPHLDGSDPTLPAAPRPAGPAGAVAGWAAAGWLPLPAAAIAGAVIAVVWQQRRRRFQPGPPGPARRHDPDLTPTPAPPGLRGIPDDTPADPTPNPADAANRRRPPTPTPADPPGSADPAPHPHGSPAYPQLWTTAAGPVVGTDRHRWLTLPDLPRPLLLTGPGALDAARGLLITIASRHALHGGGTHLLLTAADAHTLLPHPGGRDAPIPGTYRSADLPELLTTLAGWTGPADRQAVIAALPDAPTDPRPDTRPAGRSLGAGPGSVLLYFTAGIDPAGGEPPGAAAAGARPLADAEPHRDGVAVLILTTATPAGRRPAGPGAQAGQPVAAARGAAQWHVAVDGTVRPATGETSTGHSATGRHPVQATAVADETAIRLAVLPVGVAAALLGNAIQASPARAATPASDTPAPPTPAAGVSSSATSAVATPIAVHAARADDPAPPHPGLSGSGLYRPLYLQVLGPPAVFTADDPLSPDDPLTADELNGLDGPDGGRVVRLPRTPGLYILVYLAIHRDGASSDELKEALWPEATTSAASRQLSTNLSALRKTLEAAAGAPVLRHTTDPGTAGRSYVWLDPAQVQVDLWQLHDLLDTAAALTDDTHTDDAFRTGSGGEEHDGPGEPTGDNARDSARDNARGEVLDGRRAVLRRAAQLPAGELARGLHADWLPLHREATSRHLIEVYCHLAGTEPDDRIATALLQRAIGLAPSTEALYRALMRRHAAAGNHMAVQHTYAALIDRLAESHDVPDAETRHLAAQLTAQPATQPPAQLSQVGRVGRHGAADAPSPASPRLPVPVRGRVRRRRRPGRVTGRSGGASRRAPARRGLGCTGAATLASVRWPPMTGRIPPLAGAASAGGEPPPLPGTVAFRSDGYPILGTGAGPPPRTTPPVLVAHDAPRPQLPAAASRPGTTTTTAAGAAGALIAAVRRSGSRRRRPNRLVAAAVITVVLLFAAGGGVVAVASRTDPPQHLVEAFFAALGDRDSQELRGFGICRDSPLCDPGALATGYQAPQHLQILATGTNSTGSPRTPGPPAGRAGDRLLVTVRYDLAGVGHEDTLGLTRFRQHLFGHVWRITEAPGATLQLTSTYYHRVHLAGIDLPVGDHAATDPGLVGAGGRATSPDRLWAPPGRYTITTAADPLVESTRIEVTVAEQHTPAPVTVDPHLKPGLDTDITRQIRTRIDQCAAQPDLHPDTDPGTGHTCPFGYDSPYTVTDRPQWKVKRYPAIALHLGADGTVGVTTTTAGRITLTYRWTLDILEPRRWTTDTVTQPITVEGRVVLDHGILTWTP